MKRKIVKIVVGTLVVLAVVLFVLANFRMVENNYDKIVEMRSSCDGLDVGDSCEIVSKKGVVDGSCKDTVRGELVCKIGSKGKK